MRESFWRATPLIQLSVLLHMAALALCAVRPGLWHWALAAVALNHALLTAVGLWPRSTWLGPNLTRLPAAAAARNEIALTVDDGPDPLVTPQVLDLLDHYGAKATFFCIGTRAERHPELVRDIARRGHALENHSQHHRHHFALLGPRGFSRELQAAQDTLTGLSGNVPLFFRAPAGLRNPFLQPTLRRLGLRLASWSARGFDTRTANAGVVQARLMRHLQPGAILLLHDGNAARTASGAPVILEVLPGLLQAMVARQLHAVTLRAAHA
ncbi:MAG: polysaccharide deacetylase [Polaromonas sp.]|nr:polysaccharide deacetylase [Polaromonas sp.]